MCFLFLQDNADLLAQFMEKALEPYICFFFFFLVFIVFCYFSHELWEAPALKEAGIKVPDMEARTLRKSFSVQEPNGVGSTMQILSYTYIYMSECA